jgi:hypothetical protein
MWKCILNSHGEPDRIINEASVPGLEAIRSCQHMMGGMKDESDDLWLRTVPRR